MGKVTAGVLLVLGLSLQTATLAAQEIYRWVDDDGVVHFSDSPPATASAEVETVEIEVREPSREASGEDIYNIEATAERMQAIREEYEADREARRERQGRSRSSPPVTQYPEGTSFGVPYGYPLYPRPPVPRPPPPRPPRPEPPADDTATLRPPGRDGG